MYCKYLNNIVPEDLILFELLQSIEDHKTVKVYRGKNKKVLIRLYDFNDCLSMEYSLKGFTYMKLRAKIKDFGKFCRPFPAYKLSGEAGKLNSGINTENF